MIKLTAPASATVGGNGVYFHGTGGGFPASSYKDANYWVDVRFVPSPWAEALASAAWRYSTCAGVMASVGI